MPSRDVADYYLLVKSGALARCSRLLFARRYLYYFLIFYEVYEGDAGAFLSMETAPTTPMPCSIDLPPNKAAASIDQESDLRLRSWPKPIRLKRSRVVLLLVACASGLLVGVIVGTNMVRAVPPPLPARRPTNVIFMVADGYGPASATLARVLRARVYNPVVPEAEGDGVQPLELDAFMTGQVHTRSADHLITDSAAGASAWSCGQKTNNKFVAVDLLERPCATLMEAATAAGMATGVAVTSSVTDATPAAFAAHAPHLPSCVSLRAVESEVLLLRGEEEAAARYDLLSSPRRAAGDSSMTCPGRVPHRCDTSCSDMCRTRP